MIRLSGLVAIALLSAGDGLAQSARSKPPVIAAGCTVGVASAQCLEGIVGRSWMQIQNVHATNAIACSWNNDATLNNLTSFMLQPGQAASWGSITIGFVPDTALRCVASGADTPLYVEWQ